ncbi:hypothetical protein LEP1GSC172_4138 [Leptospira noguchii]|uniref:Uncharacterized protein n=2 Tax=Leptospira noguchii TaxID=28182 RepID=T0FKZ1_9LEPT|nr:hypothetical protein LEP1GSC172_4138 [Leptospira noguchii]EQA70774.1 hypothetical protein LEP1GSC059_3482 [Leptospira noguchii serovar Panama str. CZ214]
MQITALKKSQFVTGLELKKNGEKSSSSYIFRGIRKAFIFLNIHSF